MKIVRNELMSSNRFSGDDELTPAKAVGDYESSRDENP